MEFSKIETLSPKLALTSHEAPADQVVSQAGRMALVSKDVLDLVAGLFQGIH